MQKFYLFRFLATVLLAIFLGFSANAQTITAFSPATGPVGTSVTLTGTGFNTTASNNVVFFGSTMATVTSASATSLTVTVPSGASYQRISVTDITTSLTGYSASPFVVTYNKGVINYASHVDILAGTAPWNIAIGDLDGDGKPDVVVTNLTSGTISVYRNQTSSNTIVNGSFTAKVDYTTGTTPQSVAIADIDGDGKPDVIVSNAGSASVSVFRNTSTSGAISLAAKVDFTTGTTPYTVAAGDLDGDGKPDLVTANSGSTTASVLRNTSTVGVINFATKVDLTTGATPRGIAIVDFDGDGKADIAVSNNGAATVSVFKNSATAGNIILANFAARVNFTVGTSPNGLAVGDLDGDGKPDIAVSNYGSTSVSLLLNTTASGTINFAPKFDLTTASSTRYVALADMDGDGKVDVVAENDISNSVSVFKNKSTTGTLSFNTKLDYNTLGTPEGVALGDLNGDGQADIVIADNNATAFTVLRNILNNSALSSISLSSGTLSPTFVGTTTSYTASVNNGTSSVTLTPTLSDVNATVKVNGNAVTSGAASGSIALTVGTNTITIIVTAQDATTTTYTVTVTRAPAYYSKATGDLSSLATYGTNTDGTGTPPTDFNGSGANAAYQLANRGTYTLTSNLTLGSQLNIPAASTLDLAGNTLTITTLAGTGTLSGSNASSLTVTGAVSGLAFTSGKEQLLNLTLGSSASVTLSSSLAIASTGSVTLGASAALNTNNTLTLKSDASGTAQIAALGTGATITGNATAERYIADKRAWRLISSPVFSTQTISAAWQEGGAGTASNPNPGYGTFIIGNSTSNGFDIASSSGSLLAYNGTAFNSVPNTNATTVSTNTGYFLFSVGNRGVNATDVSAHSSTVLRSTGIIATGTQTANIAASGYTLVGNPYAAPVDFSKLTRSASIPDQFYAWDISLGTYGGYVLISNTGGGTYTSVPTSPSGLNKIIASGEAIFVSTTGTAGTLTADESSKATGAGTNTFANFSTYLANNTQHNFRVNLTDANANLVDGVMASYAAGNSNNVDAADAPKLSNFYENISLIRSGKQLTLERRSELTAKDTLFVQLSGVKTANYQLQLNSADLNQPGITAYVEDAYVHTRTKLDLGQITNLPFSTNADTASYKNRFQVTFSPATAPAIATKTSHIGASVVAYPNPAVQKQVNLSFDGMPAGSYNITVTNTFGQVMQKNSVTYNGDASSKLLSTDYSTGVYTVNIQSAGYNQSIKVIVP